MRVRAILVVAVLCVGVSAENLEKAQKRELEAQVKAMKAEAEALEKKGQLAEARVKYAESQALIEMKDVTDAIEHLDDEIHKRVKDTLNDSRKLYEARKFQEAAARLEEGIKLQASQTLLAYNLALCHYQIGDRDKALDYLSKAKAGTADPKQREKLLELLTFFTTGDTTVSANDKDKDQINHVNHLSDSIGVEAFLDDEGGDDAEGNDPAAA